MPSPATLFQALERHWVLETASLLSCLPGVLVLSGLNSNADRLRGTEQNSQFAAIFLSQTYPQTQMPFVFLLTKTTAALFSFARLWLHQEWLEAFRSFRGCLNRSQAKPQSYLKHLHEQNTPVLSIGQNAVPKAVPSMPLFTIRRTRCISTHSPGQIKPVTATRSLFTVQTEFFVVDKEELESDVGSC